jgi:hypothetical protein
MCAEAVFLGILLTQGWANLQRLPLGFKTRGSDGQVRICMQHAKVNVDQIFAMVACCVPATHCKEAVCTTIVLGSAGCNCSTLCCVVLCVTQVYRYTPTAEKLLCGAHVSCRCTVTLCWLFMTPAVDCMVR